MQGVSTVSPRRMAVPADGGPGIVLPRTQPYDVASSNVSRRHRKCPGQRLREPLLTPLLT